MYSVPWRLHRCLAATASVLSANPHTTSYGVTTAVLRLTCRVRAIARLECPNWNIVRIAWMSGTFSNSLPPRWLVFPHRHQEKVGSGVPPLYPRSPLFADPARRARPPPRVPPRRRPCIRATTPARAWSRRAPRPRPRSPTAATPHAAPANPHPPRPACSSARSLLQIPRRLRRHLLTPRM